MKTKRWLIKICCCGLCIAMLSGCGGKENQDPLMSESKATLVKMVNDTNTELVGCYERIKEVEELLKQVQDERGPTSAITEMPDGTGRKTFNTVEGVFSLPVEFKYPGSAQAPSSSSINITEDVKVSPTYNWDCKLNGTSLELSHSSGIAGTISIGTLDREAQKFQASELDGYMEELLGNMAINTKRLSNLFINGNKMGVDDVSQIFIDESDAMIRCGILGYGEVSVQYMFVYTGKQDAAKDEVILSLIKTLQIWNTVVSVE